MDTTYSGGGAGRFFGGLFVLVVVIALIVVGITMFATIDTSKSASQGSNAEWLRQCMNNAGPDARFIAKVDQNMFYKFCETHKGTVVAQSLTKEGNGQYAEDSIREMTYLKRIGEAVSWARNLGYEIIGWLP